MLKPRIGVVDQGTDKVWQYVDPFRELGAAVEVLWWRDRPDPLVDARRFEGFVFCGGDDVDGRHFGEPTHPLAVLDPPERDEYEIALCREVVARGLPVLAVCRGAQVLNVALGGGVEQHIPDTPGRCEHGGGVVHTVRIVPGSLLHELAGSDCVEVNSYHHQAVGRLGRGVTGCAYASDGVIEAIEGPGAFCLGVQWHPERDPRLGDALFRAFHEAARIGRDERAASAV